MTYEYEHEKQTRSDGPTESTTPRSTTTWGEKGKSVFWWPPLILGDDAARYLAGRGLDPELARRNGWYLGEVRGELRLVIPATGSTLFWQARALIEGVSPRYDSPPSPRGDAIVVVYPSDGRLPKVGVVVEGPMDALAAAECGVLGVALLGNHPPAESLDLTTRLFCGIIALVIEDRDAPGTLAGVFARLSSAGVLSTLVPCPLPYKDLAEMPYLRRQRFIHAVRGLYRQAY